MVLHDKYDRITERVRGHSPRCLDAFCNRPSHGLHLYQLLGTWYGIVPQGMIDVWGLRRPGQMSTTGYTVDSCDPLGSRGAGLSFTLQRVQ